MATTTGTSAPRHLMTGDHTPFLYLHKLHIYIWDTYSSFIIQETWPDGPGALAM